MLLFLPRCIAALLWWRLRLRLQLLLLLKLLTFFKKVCACGL